MGIKPNYVMHEAFPLPAGFPLDGFASGLRYEAAPGDIFVSTYPKCGTTWVQNIVALIMRRGVPLGADEKMTELFPHLEEVGREAVATLPEPRWIKTHLPYAMTPQHVDARYIYVARNPFDCAVSYYHHTRGFPKHYAFTEGKFQDYFECFVAGVVDFGDYFDNLESWYHHKNDANVLFLTYEAIKADTRAAVLEIGAFLGANAVGDDAVVDDIVRHSSLKSMRKHPDRWTSRRPADMPGFIRKGIVGDWASHFSPEQTRRLLDKFMARAGAFDPSLESLWPAVIATARATAAGLE